MHRDGSKTFNAKLANLCFSISVDQRNEATNVGKPIVKIPKPNVALTTNNAPINNIETGKQNNAPAKGKIKFIPEKKNVCEPRTKLNLKNEAKPKTAPNTPIVPSFLNKLSTANPSKLKTHKSN